MNTSYRIVPKLAALLLLSACSEPSSTQVLQSRASASLNPAQACDRPASVEYLPTGARFRMPDAALFVVGRTDLSDCGRFVLADIIQAMLDPRIMAVVIEPGANINMPDAYLPRERANMVKKLLSNVGFVSGQPPVVVQAAPVPSPGVWGVVVAVADRG